MSHTLKILAPAGDEEMLRAAVYSGADCVYLGVRGFNARRAAKNFDDTTLARAVGFCHARGCQVYAAINTLVLPGREAAMEQAVEHAAEAGCDAVIVQDLATALAVRSIAPGLQLHASTQMSVHSLAGVEQLAELGFTRAILARELTEAEIAHIAAHSPIELEVFVHGALCVSVSGQCYASAFLGGRSANRGGCAGPCRLPFKAVAGAAGQAGGRAAAQGQECYHLSMKDLSILDALPRLEAMGVSAAKIEGRLRGPEYVAAVVDAARSALDGQPYDKDFLRDIFSRSGFTGGWFTGQAVGEGAEPGNATAFGARTEADSEATKKALPRARALYRRERPRVPVEMALRFDSEGGALAVAGGGHTVRLQIDGPLPPAQRDPADALRAALEKTGGTPFYVDQSRPVVVKTGGAFLPAGAAGALRRQALEQLLAQLEAPAPVEHHRPAASSFGLITGGDSPGRALHQAATQHRASTGRPLLRARFERVDQMPPEAAELCAALLLPLEEADRVPQALRPKTWLWLPRVLFGAAEQRAAGQIQAAAGQGFAGFEATNLAHFRLCRGLPVSAGFGLNLANPVAVAALGTLGCAAATLSPELSLPQLRALAAAEGLNGAIATDALCYGHLPLMITRACPLQNAAPVPHGAAAHPQAGGAAPACAGCTRLGALADRTGRVMPLACRDGARTLYNPVPLWMADRLAQLPTDTATLYFTLEDRPAAAGILQAFARGTPAEGDFTRGLYDRGTEE